MGDRGWLVAAGAISICLSAGWSTVGCMDCPTCEVPDEPWAIGDAAVDRTIAQPYVSALPCDVPSDAILVSGEYTGPITHQHRCTSDQIAAIGAACFGVISTDADASADASDASDGDAEILEAGDAATSCDAVEATNYDCATCINGDPGDGGGFPYGPSPVLLPAGQGTSAMNVNIAGCVAAISSASVSCKESYEALSMCAHTACSTCTPSEAPACLKFESTDRSAACPFNAPVDPTCASEIASVPSAVQQTECAAASTDFATQFSIVASTMCGP